MKIKLNNTELNLTMSEVCLVSLLEQEGLFHDSGIAIAVNNEIMPRQTWENYAVKDNDNILIIKATQGG